MLVPADLDQGPAPISQSFLYLDTIVSVVGHLEPVNLYITNDGELQPMNAIVVGGEVVQSCSGSVPGLTAISLCRGQTHCTHNVLELLLHHGSG